MSKKLPDWYLEKYVTGADLHLYLSGDLRQFANDLEALAKKLKADIDSHTTKELIRPRTTPWKFSKPFQAPSGNEIKIRLIETHRDGIDARITHLYEEMGELRDDPDDPDKEAWQSKLEELRILQHIEAAKIGRNAKRENDWEEGGLEKFFAETDKLLAKYEKAKSPFERLDRVSTKTSLGVYIGAGHKGVVLQNLDQDQDDGEHKVSVCFDPCFEETSVGVCHVPYEDLEYAEKSADDPVYLLQALLHEKYYPDLDLSIDKAKNAVGSHFLDIEKDGDSQFVIEYLSSKGVFCFCTCSDPGYGPHSDEQIAEVEPAFLRAVELIEKGYRILPDGH